LLAQEAEENKAKEVEFNFDYQEACRRSEKHFDFTFAV